jgi:NADH-quinone oxidoreductase subunit J
MLTILTVNAKEENLPKEPHKYKWIMLSTILVTPFTILLYKTLVMLPDHFSTIGTINAKVVGKLLFSEWVLPFEILSILLLSAMVGAIVIARKKMKRPGNKQERRR